MNVGRGLSVVLMGIDGAGKTSLLEHLRKAVVETGIESVNTSKQAAIRLAGSTGQYPAASLQRLWLELWRLLFGGGHSEQGPADAVIPLQFGEQTPVASNWIIDGLPVEVSGVRRSGPVASAFTEVAVDQLIQAQVIDPVLGRGAIAMMDGFGYKAAIKNVTVARAISDDAMPDAALDNVEALLHAAYSAPYLQPDIGFLLDADPRRSYEWRMRQEGRLGVNEDFWLAGRKGESSYLDLQTAMAEKLRAAADEWGWHVIRIDGGPQQETAERAVEIMMRDPGMRRLIERGADVG